MAPVRESTAHVAQEEPAPSAKHGRIPGDLQGALHHVKVPCYFVDRFGVIRWINHATRDLVGDVRGRQQSSVVAPEQAREARESFTRKMLGAERSTNQTVVVVGKNGERTLVEINSVPVEEGGRIVGVFGMVPHREADAAPAHPHLTPRRTRSPRSAGHSTAQRRSST
jgi:PAS domain S-box-containing protein